MRGHLLSRAAGAIVTTALFASGLGAVAAAPADAATRASSRYLLNHLPVGSEHKAGYARSKFSLWADADHDGCNTRYEVLIAEAVRKPRVRSGCRLSGGRWVSRYDGKATTNPSTFDIDHVVPLAEVWQSGGYRWTAATRKAYANDLGYFATLIAVTAHENRSKGDREPQQWMPDRRAYGCTYVAQWVAVKWRWHLKVNAGEKSFLTRKLRSCHWPTITRPRRATVHVAGSGGGGGGGAPGPTVNYAVHPGAFCSEHGYYGYTAAGTLMRCKTSATDSRYRWRAV